MKYIAIVCFLLTSLGLWAQPENVQVEVKDGKKYYVHIVQNGNTLWGIQTLYKVKVADIIRANPNTESGIKDGQKLLIPIPNNQIASDSADTAVKKHVVEKKETLYGISKQYGVSIDQLIDANPGVENGLQLGQELNIPSEERVSNTTKDASTVVKKDIKVSFSDSVIQHVVLDHETMYSISKRFMVPVEEIQNLNGMRNTRIRPGDILKIPIKKEKVQKVEVREVKPIELRKVDSTLLFKKKDKYHIAVLLPFFLDKGDGVSDQVSTMATEFYMGVQLAIDSLAKMGMKAKVFVYDSRNDSASVKAILEKPEFKTIDMVIGPLFEDNILVVSRWCKENRVRMICPVASNTKLLRDNQFVHAAIPSDVTLMEGAAKYIHHKHVNDQLVLVKPISEKDLVLYDSFRNSFMNDSTSGKRLKLIETNLEDFTTFIRKDGSTVFIMPSTDKLTSIKFMNRLSNPEARIGNGVVTVFGTKEWANFDDIKGTYKNKFNFHFAGPNDLNYTYEETKSLLKKYRKKYNADMTKMSVQGFDVMMAFSNQFLLGKELKHGIMNNIKMEQKGLGNGYENKMCFIIKQEGFDLLKIAEIND
jgi:LysM repeat protein